MDKHQYENYYYDIFGTAHKGDNKISSENTFQFPIGTPQHILVQGESWQKATNEPIMPNVGGTRWDQNAAIWNPAPASI